MSPKIQNEFICILANLVKENILNWIRKSNYFVIILHCTPDISHADQMSFISQYVVAEDNEVEMQESFLGFITDLRKIAYDIKKMNLDWKKRLLISKYVEE